MQKQLCQKAQPVIVQDAVERIPEELTETKKLLTERDSLLKEVGSEVNQLQSKLKQSEKTLLKFSERELAYKEKEMQLTETVQDMQKQLRQKARELELLKMEHSSNLSMLNIKQLTVDDLTKRCSKMSAEIAQMKKTIENVSKLEMMWKQKEAIYQEQIRHLQAASKDEKQIDQLVLKNHVELRRNTANAELVTDDVENLTGATAEGGEIQKESSVEKVETDSCSTDQFGGNDSPQSMKTCKLCSLTFPKGTAIQVIKDHLHSHQKVCPICNKHLELKCTQQEFELHVSEHLANTIKFTDGRKICPMCDLEFPTAWAQDQFEIHVNEHFTDTLRP